MSDPFQVVRDFEYDLADYCNAGFAVATTSCTMALTIALKALAITEGTRVVKIPKHTYVGVAQAVINAGHLLLFDDRVWCGQYVLDGTKIVDSARWLDMDCHTDGCVTCLSFHWSKHLQLGQGGAILHDDCEMDDLYRRLRFDGRSERIAIGEDKGIIRGAYHAYMMPRDAAEGLTRLALLPKDNLPLPNSNYPDLSEIFE